MSAAPPQGQQGQQGLAQDAAAIMDSLDSFQPDFTHAQLAQWFQDQHGRAPVANDIYQVGKQLYQLGAYSRARVCFEYYASVAQPDAPVIGRHLLAYCLLQNGDRKQALREFTQCAINGYHEDWQFVVELTLELDQLRSS